MPVTMPFYLQAEYDTKRKALTPEGVMLARCFQQLAFPNKQFSFDFEPAPLYVIQAYEILYNKPLAHIFGAALHEAHKKEVPYA